ncbi:hypothetical protein QP179_18635 [Sphingomonas aurantiaca]|uniref:NACHT domain-containing protein n=1 Tax=Sphingomonas aurantiaca TaxID=185949 RepID=UPI002FE15D4D
MSYDFARFSPQSFERLVQAISAAIGDGRTQIFGAGKDGAREATIEGPVQLLGSEISGYTVLQAKHKLVIDDNEANISWIKRQIDLEMKKFSSVRRALRTPDNYVFATNIRLTAAAADVDGKGGGGIDTVTDYLSSKCTQAGIKTAILWHADTIFSLLDAYPRVRQSFTGWIEPSDVLYEYFKAARTPDQSETLLRYLRSTIRQSRDIKTKDAGQALSRTVGVSDVFVDLPVDITHEEHREGQHHDMTSNTEHDYEPDFDEWDIDALDGLEDDTRASALLELIDKAADKFSLESNLSDEDIIRCQQGGNRILLLGGPGQGKSTIGQFVSQLYRASILSTRRVANNVDVNTIIDSILNRASSIGVAADFVKRIPLHVELPKYADEKSKVEREGRSLSIFGHVAALISKASDADVTSPLLQDWLKDYPSVFILDGLDEVPPTGSRSFVIGAIDQLSDFIRDLNLDSIVVVTSRPQGYRDELSKKQWAYWRLQDLNVKEALKIAAALAPALILDETRRAEVLDVLSSAALDPATAALMVNPLQVSLLFNLVTAHNNIPKDRWTLFYRHYETLRDREIAKGGDSGRLIGEFKSQIDRLHYDAGFILHVRAEQTGAANPYLTLEEFTHLIRRHLLADGFDEGVDESVAALAAISTDRLVFLRSGIEGQISFDVRSLQEFMAAARITLSPESKVSVRLGMIIGKSHWLHVFKIACSRIFGSAGLEALREPVIGLIDALNNGDDSDESRLTQFGSQAAAALLGDGVASNVPLYRRRLMLRALAMLEAPSVTVSRSLVDLVHPNVSVAVKQDIEERILRAGNRERRNIFAFLFLISHYYDDMSEWVDEVCNRHFNGNDMYDEIIKDFDFLPGSPGLKAWLRKQQCLGGPARALRWAAYTIEPSEETEPAVTDSVLIHSSGRPSEADILVLDDDNKLRRSNIAITFRPIRSVVKINGCPDPLSVEWESALALQSFAMDPRKSRLFDVLDKLSKVSDISFGRRMSAPWVVIYALSKATSADEIAKAAERCAAGDFGDVGEWDAAEARWRDHGATIGDLVASRDSENPLREIAIKGVPAPLGRRVTSRGFDAGPALAAIIRADTLDGWIAKTCIAAARVSSSLEFKSRVLQLRPVEPVTRRMILALAIHSFEFDQLHDDAKLLLKYLIPVEDVFLPLGGEVGLSSLINIFNAGEIGRETISVIASCFSRNRYPYHSEDLLKAICIGGLDTYEDDISRKAAIFLSVMAGIEVLSPAEAAAELSNAYAYHGTIFSLTKRGLTTSYQMAVAEYLLKADLMSTDDGLAAVAYPNSTSLQESKASNLFDSSALVELELPPEATVVLMEESTAY